jgi:transposase
VRDSTASTDLGRGLTVRDVARRFRVSPDRVRAWIRGGQLAALNTAAARCGRPRFVVTPEAIAEFEHGLAAATAPKPAPRRKRRPATVDFYPGD